RCGGTVGIACDIERAVFLGVISEREKFLHIIAGGFESALPVVFGGGFFAELCRASREVHLLHDRIEWEMFAVEQLLDLVPATQCAKSVDMLQKNFLCLQRRL